MTRDEERFRLAVQFALRRVEMLLDLETCVEQSARLARVAYSLADAMFEERDRLAGVVPMQPSDPRPAPWKAPRQMTDGK